MIDKGWPEDIVSYGFSILHIKRVKQDKYKNKVSIYLDNEILSCLERRAKKNMLNLHEQIEDILRRSVLSQKKTGLIGIKVDDKLVELFSRERRGRRK